MNLWKAVLFVSLLFCVACGPRQYSNTNTTTQSGAVEWPDVGAPAQVAKANNDVAVIVAIEDYVFLPDIAGARQTAADWAAFFDDSLGVNHVMVVSDSEATKEGIERVMMKAQRLTAQNGRVWFVFVGHGAPSPNGDGLLVGADAQQNFDSLQKRSVSHSALKGWTERLPGQKIVILDACFSGRASDGTLLAQGTQPVLPVTLKSVATQTVVLSAAGNDELAGDFPTNPRPAFSYVMLGALRGWAANGGSVTARDAIAYSQKHLNMVPSRTQTPTLVGDASIVLTSSASEPDPGLREYILGLKEAPKVAASGATSSTQTYDSGFGLRFEHSSRWEPQSLEPDDLSDKAYQTVGRFHHKLAYGHVVVQRIPDGDNYFDENLRTIHKSWLESGGMLVKTTETSWPSGVLREYKMPNGADNRPRKALMWYGVGADALWTIGGVVDPSDEGIYRTDLMMAIESVQYD